MSGVLMLGLVVAILALLDAAAAAFGVDSRPEHGMGHTVLS
jgi:hypothetical protein